MTDEQSKHNRAKFEKVWHDEVTRVEILKNELPLNSKKRASLRPSLHRALLKDFIITTWIVQPLMFASSTARIVMSISLGYLIQSFIDKSKEGYWWAAILVFCNAVVLFEHHHVFFFTVSADSIMFYPCLLTIDSPLITIPVCMPCLIKQFLDYLNSGKALAVQVTYSQSCTMKMVSFSRMVPTGIQNLVILFRMVPVIIHI
jgi:hypothetical protein